MCWFFFILQKMKEQKELLDHLKSVELKGAEILTDRQEVIALDKRRNDDRVGMRALQKQNINKCWMTIGPLLIKMPAIDAEKLLVEGTNKMPTFPKIHN